MSKLFNKYLKLKKEDPSKIYLFKSGIFYLFIDNDAINMSNYLNLKLTNLNKNIYKCGFPSNSINKYLSIFKNLNLNVAIIDNIDEKPLDPKTYILNSNVMKLIEKLSKINPESLSISEAYSLVDSLSSDAKIIEEEIKN